MTSDLYHACPQPKGNPALELLRSPDLKARQPETEQHEADVPLASREPDLQQDHNGNFARRRPAHRPRALSIWIRSMIALSIACLLGAMIFLSWFWFGDREATTWCQLVLSSYATQAITISGVVIRTALSTLAPITTSMIAAIVLERHGARLDVLLRLSIVRYTSSGPLSLSLNLPCLRPL